MNYLKLTKEIKKNPDNKKVRTLKDMRLKFSEQLKVKKILSRKNPVIYTVLSKKMGKNKIAAITILNPGKIEGEFFTTKGHKHKKPFSEDYILIKGEGKLLLQNKICRVVNLKKRERIVVNGKSAHKLVNTGKKKLEVLTIYNKNSGHNYDIKFKKRITKNGI